MVLSLVLVLAATPRVLVVTAWGEMPSGEKWSGSAFAPLACTTPDAGLTGGPNCLANAPATAEVTMLDGTTVKAVGKKKANVSLVDCGANGEQCTKRPLWVRQRTPSKPSKAKSVTSEDAEPAWLTATELRPEVGVWPKEVPIFALVPGPTGVPLPKELPPMARPYAKNPSREGPEATAGNVFTFQLPGQPAPFQLLSLGDAFAYKAPGAAGYVWASSHRSAEPVALLAAVDLDGDGVPEVVLGQYHQEGHSDFWLVELGPKPRILRPGDASLSPAD